VKAKDAEMMGAADPVVLAEQNRNVAHPDNVYVHHNVMGRNVETMGAVAPVETVPSGSSVEKTTSVEILPAFPIARARPVETMDVAAPAVIVAPD